LRWHSTTKYHCGGAGLRHQARSPAIAGVFPHVRRFGHHEGPRPQWCGVVPHGRTEAARTRAARRLLV